MITLSKLRRLARGRLQADDLPPFVIMRDKIRMNMDLKPTTEERISWEYAVVFGNRADYVGLKDELIVDRVLAMNLIKHCNMNCVASTEDCQLYELPGEPFKEKYSHQGLKFTTKVSYKKSC